MGTNTECSGNANIDIKNVILPKTKKREEESTKKYLTFVSTRKSTTYKSTALE